MKRGYVGVPGGQIHYREAGVGQPVVLLHMTVSSSDEYAQVLPILGDQCRAIAVDTPGYGESDQPPAALEIGGYADSLAAFLDALGLPVVSLVGNKTGATIAQDFAARWPRRVDKLVLFDCPYWDKAEERLVLAMEQAYQPPMLQDDGSHLTAIWSLFKQYLSPGASAETIQASLMQHFRPGPRCQEAHQALFRYDGNPVFPMLRLPTLLLTPSYGIFHSVVEKVQALIPRSRIVVLEGGTFAAPREMPREFAEAVLAFLNNPGV